MKKVMTVKPRVEYMWVNISLAMGSEEGVLTGRGHSNPLVTFKSEKQKRLISY